MTLVCVAALLVAACGKPGSDGPSSARVEAEAAAAAAESAKAASQVAARVDSGARITCSGPYPSEEERARERDKLIDELQRRLAVTRDEDEKADLRAKINALRPKDTYPKTPCVPNGDPLSPCG